MVAPDRVVVRDGAAMLDHRGPGPRLESPIETRFAYAYCRQTHGGPPPAPELFREIRTKNCWCRARVAPVAKQRRSELSRRPSLLATTMGEQSMTHFVPIPPDREYWVPKLRELSLFDKNATA